jgi:hypothetical protein
MATQYDADVIVIGSGAIGSNAAHLLAQRGKSVIILEAGERIPRWKIVENFRSSPRKNNLNDPYPNFPWAMSSFDKDYIENTGNFNYVPYQLRLVGGTTWHWAAATWRFLPNDMKMKSLYGVSNDWPLDYSDLEPGMTLPNTTLAWLAATPTTSRAMAPPPIPAQPPLSCHPRGRDLLLPPPEGADRRQGLQLHPRAQWPHQQAL